jgi:hypothetical protein
MNLNEFLGHKTRESGNYLKKWQKRQPPRIDLALHTTAPMAALWQHGKPRVQESRREGFEGVREVWSGAVNCVEPEAVLRRQYSRAQDDERDCPPTVCPICLLIEAVRRAVRQGKIGFAQPVFRWAGDDPSKAVTVTAAGTWNGYSDERRLTREQVAAMRRANVKVSEAWRENMMAKCNYVFVIADLQDPGAGALITTETTAVGDAMKAAIRDRMTQLGEDEGDPFQNPVAFRWEHFPNAANFKDKYKVLPMPRLPLDDVMPVIRGEAPSIDHVVRAPNMAKLRADFEAACLVELPWDDIFGPAEAMYSAAAAPDPAEEIGAEEAANLPVPTTTLASAGAANDSADDDDDQIVCDVCGRDMAEDEFDCKGCGARYDQAGNILPKEPKPARCRSAAAAPAAPAAATRRGPPARPAEAARAKAPDLDEVFAGDDFPPWA